MYYKYYKNLIPKELCERIINTFNKDELLSDTLTDNNITKNYGYLDFSFNKRKSTFRKDSEYPVLKELTNILVKHIENEMKFLKLDSENFIYTFNRYSEGDFLDYHVDGAEIKNGAMYTLIIELNTEYDGGEFYYVCTEEKERVSEKSEGGLFIFDSNMRHKVNMVSKGLRFSLNCWPKFKKNKVLI